MSEKTPKLTIRLTYEGDSNWQNHMHVQRVIDWAEISLVGPDLPAQTLKYMLRQLTAAVDVKETP